MSVKTVTSMLAVALLTPTVQALAETGAREDHSQILVWVFLGMCALIVIVQLVPVAMLAFGLIKGLFQGKQHQAQPQETTDK